MSLPERSGLCRRTFAPASAQSRPGVGDPSPGFGRPGPGRDPFPETEEDERAEPDVDGEACGRVPAGDEADTPEVRRVPERVSDAPDPEPDYVNIGEADLPYDG